MIKISSFSLRGKECNILNKKKEEVMQRTKKFQKVWAAVLSAAMIAGTLTGCAKESVTEPGGNRIDNGECSGGGRRETDNYQDSWRGQQGHG